MYILYKAALSGLSLEASVVTFYIYFYISLRVTVFVRLVFFFLFVYYLFGWRVVSFLFFWRRGSGFVSDPPNIWCVEFGFHSLFRRLALVDFFSKCPPLRTSCTRHSGYSAASCTYVARLDQL